MATPHDVEALLSHTDWARRLARRLVRDPEQAEDLLQETWVAALRSTGGEWRSPRAWIGTVLRRLSRERLRSEAARRARERAHTPGEDSPDTADLFARASAHRQVVEAVFGLAPAYREVLLLRYFDDKQPSEIARQLGCPVATVKTRLQRALAKLRGVLDEEHGGDGRSWALALLPLARDRTRPLSTVGLAVAGLTVTGALGAWGILLTTDDSSRLAAASSVEHVSSATGSDGGQDGPTSGSGSQRSVAVDGRPADAPGTAAARAPELRQPRLIGRVVTTEGLGIGGALLRYEPDRAGERASSISFSAPDGTFEFPDARTPGMVEVDSADWIARRPIQWNGTDHEPLEVVALPTRALSGRVTDELGTPVEGARLSWAGETRNGEPAPPGVTSLSGEDGSFVLGRVPDASGGALHARCAGFVARSIPVDTGAWSDLVLQLAAAGRPVSGRVEDTSGRPLPDARVTLAGRTVGCAPDGRFTLRAPSPDGVQELARRLVAQAPGHRPVVHELPQEHELTGSGHDDLLLVLDPAPASIAGRVLDQRREPITGARVWITDPTPLSWSPSLELPVSGRVLFEDPDDLLLLEGSRASFGRWHPAVTDEHGRFELSGVADRTYRLLALAPNGQGLARPVQAAAGERDVELVLRHANDLVDLEGRVVDERGLPIAGARVGHGVRALDISLAGEEISLLQGSGRVAWTDLDGHFLLEDVPDRTGYVRVTSKGTTPAVVASEDAATAGGGLLQALAQLGGEIVLARSFQLSVSPRDESSVATIDSSAPPLTLGVVDDRGQPLDLEVRDLDHVVMLRRVALKDGHGGPWTVSGRACELVLQRDGEPERRIPVDARGEDRVHVEI